MSSINDEVHEEMVKELFARLDNHMTSTLIDNMEEVDVEAFIKLNEEKKSKNEIEQFIKDKIPDAQGVMSRAMIEFRETYLGGVVDARNAPSQNATTENNTADDTVKN